MTPFDSTPPTQPDRVPTLVINKLPHWMSKASTAARRQMRTAAKQPAPWFEHVCQVAPDSARKLARDYATYQSLQAQAQALLDGLPPLAAFARRLLTEQIETRHGLRLDVDRTYLFNASKAAAYQPSLQGDTVAATQRAFKLATQSLLHSALQNFEMHEAQPRGLDVESITAQVLDSDRFSGLLPSGMRVELEAHAFAALCRELDIGGRYQTMIDSLFAPAKGDRNDLRSLLGEAQRLGFELEVDRAALSGQIEPPLRDALLQLAREGSADYQQTPMRCGSIELFGFTHHGALLIGLVPSAELLLHYDPLTLPYHGLLVTYLPGAQMPLATHATVAHVQAHVREQLWAYDLSHLLEGIRARDRAEFLEKMRDCLQPIDWNTFSAKPGHQGGEAQRVRDPQAWVPLRVQPLGAPLFDAWGERQRLRLKDDASFHAVPTAAEDRKSAARRWAYFSQLAMNAINVGAFFVPGLGQLMMGLSVLQLGYEVFEGLESWAEGERDRAFDYLLDVIENVALGAALGAAGSATGVPALERIPVETPSFIEELETVELANGEQRLWRPDLAPFAHDVILPAGLVPDDFGLYHHAGKTWLALEDRTFQVNAQAGSDEYRLIHPRKPLGYAPIVRHNGAGAWLHELDRPRSWPLTTLLRRAGHLAARLSEEQALAAMHVSGTNEAVLRRAISDNLRLPALLEDTLRRFDLDLQVRSQPTPGPLHEAFERRYREQSPTQMPETQTLRHRYPSLPMPVSEELVRHATVAERRGLADGQVPLRIAQETRRYQQQVRLARAYEGLHLDCVRNWDSDRLALHSLARLPGWPAELALIIEQRSYSPLRIDSIGPADAPMRSTLVSARAGYLVLPANADAGPAAIYSTLGQAVFEALSPSQRQSLHLVSAATLTQRLRQLAPLPRSDLRRLLGLQDIPLGYRSPMRLADGRLGYPLGGMGGTGGNITRRALLAQLRELGMDQGLSRSAEQILSNLEQNGLGRIDISSRLLRLQDQRDALASHLQDWRDALTSMPNPTDMDIDQLRGQLMQHWYATALPELSQQDTVLRLPAVSLSYFPLNLPDFFTATISHLQLERPMLEIIPGWTQQAAHLARFFQQFSNLRSLEMYGPVQPIAFVFVIPVIAQHLRQLETLTLIDQNIAVSYADIVSLRGLSQLRHLNLTGNRLLLSAPPDFAELTLDTLILDRMDLNHWPEGLGANALERIGALALRENGLRLLPAFLLDNQLDLMRHPVISLQGNNIIGEHLQRVLLNEDGRASRFDVDISEHLNAQLTRFRQERQSIRDTLDNWTNASSSGATPDPGVVTLRNRVADAINDFWHHQEQALLHAPLRLEQIDLSQFPTRLPAFFNDRVRNLVLSQVTGSTAQLSALLRHFSHISNLSIEGQMTADPALPTALMHLPNLRHLALRNMGLEVDDATLDSLSRIGNLHSLDLSGNRIGAVGTPPAALRTLRRLDLNEMNLDQWPGWVDELLPLDVLELSGNQLTELPLHVLSNLENDFPISSIALYGNPLTNDTIMRARTSSESQRSFTFAMDLPEDILELSWSDEDVGRGHLHMPVLDATDDAPDVRVWLHASPVENEALQDAWQQLEQQPDAGNLLALVGRLRQAASYRDRQTRVTLCQRVRKVLVIALTQPEQRLLINAIAEEALLQPETGSQTCHDGVLLVFQNIELLIANQHLLTDAADTSEGLYQELRRLYRLQALDDLAREHAPGRDEAEVRLAYRRGLNDELALGLPQDNMLYAAFADVNRDELIQAMAQVQRGERGEPLLLFAANHEQWVRYLRQHHAERFAAIEADYQAQVLALPDRFPDSALDDLGAEYQALAEDKQAKERHLIRELTILANPERQGE